MAVLALGVAPSENSQSLFGKGASRSRLEVTFKFNGSFAVCERDGSFDVPRTEFRGVWNLASIVFLEPFLKVFGETNVKVLWL